MTNEIQLNDIADELLILSKYTIDTLFQLDNCADCIALYVFYYKTAKWQKTNVIKANDTYVKKSLKWGVERIRRTKETLKQNGLIEVVQRRKDNKIEGWYIQVNYLVSAKKTANITVFSPESNKYENQQVGNPTSSFQDTNALKQYEKCFKKEDVRYIVEYLNEKAGTRYKANTNSTKKHIVARLNEGFTIDDFKAVIDKKVEQWQDNEKMCKYLRPETLFGSKFEGYLNETEPTSMYNY